MSQNEAVEDAVEYCIRNHILEEILRAHRAEVTDMLLTEYDEAFHIENEKKLSFEEGRNLERERADAAAERAEKAEERAIEAELRTSVLSLKLKGYDDLEIAGELNLSEEKVKGILVEVLDSPLGR